MSARLSSFDLEREDANSLSEWPVEFFSLLWTSSSLFLTPPALSGPFNDIDIRIRLQYPTTITGDTTGPTGNSLANFANCRANKWKNRAWEAKR